MRRMSECRDRETPRRVQEGGTTSALADFVLRDLKADEVVVLGWEWDDESAVHALPALFQPSYVFP